MEVIERYIRDTKAVITTVGLYTITKPNFSLFAFTTGCDKSLLCLPVRAEVELSQYPPDWRFLDARIELGNDSNL